MEEEDDHFIKQSIPISVCRCRDEIGKSSEEELIIPPRKELILSTVARTENYLRVRRIPELIRFLLTKVISHAPNKPVAFIEKLLDECMLFRAGHGLAPVLYENRHLEAAINSFDPGKRGWLSAGQVRRLYTSLGFSLLEDLDEERFPCEVVLSDLKRVQEMELFDLLSSGVIFEDNLK